MEKINTLIINGENSYNYRNSANKTLLSDDCYYAEPFNSCGLATIMYHEFDSYDWYVIDGQGQTINEQPYEYIGCFSDYTLTYVVMRKGKFNVMDCNGKLLSDEWFDGISEENYFKRIIKRVSSCGEVTYNYFEPNRFGRNILCDKWYKSLSPYYDGFAFAECEDGYRVLLCNGKTANDECYQEIDLPLSHSPREFSRILVRLENGKYNYLSYNGNTCEYLSESPFDYATKFNAKGVAVVKINGKSRLLKDSGEFITPQSNIIVTHTNSLYSYEGKDRLWHIVNDKGEEIYTNEYGGYCSYDNKDDGTFVFYFTNGYATFQKNDTAISDFHPYDNEATFDAVPQLKEVEIDGKKSLIDIITKEIVTAWCDNITFGDDYIVCTNSNDDLIKCYDFVGNEYSVLKATDKFALLRNTVNYDEVIAITLGGDVLVDEEFDNAAFIGNEKYLLVYKNEEYNVYDLADTISNPYKTPMFPKGFKQFILFSANKHHWLGKVFDGDVWNILLDNMQFVSEEWFDKVGEPNGDVCNYRHDRYSNLIKPNGESVFGEEEIHSIINTYSNESYQVIKCIDEDNAKFKMNFYVGGKGLVLNEWADDITFFQNQFYIVQYGDKFALYKTDGERYTNWYEKIEVDEDLMVKAYEKEDGDFVRFDIYTLDKPIEDSYELCDGCKVVCKDGKYNIKTANGFLSEEWCVGISEPNELNGIICLYYDGGRYNIFDIEHKKLLCQNGMLLDGNENKVNKRYVVWSDSNSTVWCRKTFDYRGDAAIFAFNFVHHYDGSAETVILHIDDYDYGETIETFENVNKCDY